VIAHKDMKQEQLKKLFKEALSHHQGGRLSIASVLYKKIITDEPNHFDAVQMLGVIAAQQQDFQVAEKLLERAIKINSKDSQTFYNLGIVCHKLGKLEDALSCNDQAILLNQNYSEAFYNRALVLQEQMRPDAALISYEKAIAINPRYIEAINNRGLLLKNKNELHLALECFDNAIAINPNFAEGHNNRGLTLKILKRPESALLSYERAITINPNYVEAHNNRGSVLVELRQMDAALISYKTALNINPNYALAYNNLGNLYIDLEQIDMAIDCYKKSIELNPRYAEAFNNLGNAFRGQNNIEMALSSYVKAHEIDPEYNSNLGQLVHMKMILCDWRHYEIFCKELVEKIEAQKNVANPFAILGVFDSGEIQKRCSEVYSRSLHPENSSLGKIEPKTKKNKIRIGYFSADLQHHATAYLMAGFFEAHNKEIFELVAFSFGPESRDDLRMRIIKSLDHFIDVREMSERQIAQLSRDMDIDIAIDLKGFTKDSRMDIFAYRAAPIQVNYLGYPGTIGIDYIDYIIADQILIPSDYQDNYSEKIVYLPNSYQVNDSLRVISDRLFTRRELGLAEGVFVFCSFNNGYKITPTIFDGWMRILISVKDSILWLLEDNSSVQLNLRKEAESRGISGDRLIFAKRISPSEHLARHCCADLFLDTYPCNAHTTASDSLWAGLPLITLRGESFASRVASSLLSAVGLPELITDTQSDYESLAIELANDSLKLQEYKSRLLNNRLTMPLFNTQSTTKSIELAYIQMMERYWNGLLPDNIAL
jgi:protein O-GlcNAc transferase